MKKTILLICIYLLVSSGCQNQIRQGYIEYKADTNSIYYAYLPQGKDEFVFKEYSSDDKTDYYSFSKFKNELSLRRSYLPYRQFAGTFGYFDEDYPIGSVIGGYSGNYDVYPVILENGEKYYYYVKEGYGKYGRFSQIIPRAEFENNQKKINKKYSIIKQSHMGSVKRSVDVRISEKVSENELKEIAYQVKNSVNQNYKRTFICYYLPGMEPGAGAWASTHFKPELKITIYGITVEDQKALKSLR